MLAVIDTNVLVSALISPSGKPAHILRRILDRDITLCLDDRIFTEYRLVLLRPKFRFDPALIAKLLQFIKANALWVQAAPIQLPFPDPSDKKFFEVAKCCSAVLVTGNQKHYPQDPLVKSVHEI